MRSASAWPTSGRCASICSCGPRRFRPPCILLAKIITALVYSCLSLARHRFRRARGWRAPAGGVWLSVALRLLAGSLPFIALGFLIGFRYGPNAAPAVANLIYLPMSFASGLFMPLDQLRIRARRGALAARAITTLRAGVERARCADGAVGRQRAVARGLRGAVPRAGASRVSPRRRPQVRLSAQLSPLSAPPPAGRAGRAARRPRG